MGAEMTDGPCPSSHQEERDERGRRGAVIAISGLAILVVDAAMIVLLIPWVDKQDWSVTRFGTIGYVIFYFVVFFTFIASLALVGYYFSRSSYASDKWQ